MLRDADGSDGQSIAGRAHDGVKPGTNRMSETSIRKIIQCEASSLGARLFRNNVGVLQDNRGTYVTYGLCPGSPDLVGWTPDGLFFGVEVKVPGKHPTTKQSEFLNAANNAGGIAFVAHSVDEFRREFYGRLLK